MRQLSFFFKFFYLICLFFTIFKTTCFANLYQAIARENLKSLTNIEVQDSVDGINAILNNEKKFYEILYDRLKEQLNPNEQTKRKAIFKLLCQHNLESTDVLDEKTWQDLEMLCGPKSDPTFYLASKIDRTSTQVGKAALFCKIVNPSCNIEQLENQQHIIKELVENTELFDQLDKQLKELAMPENAMLSFWAEDTFQCFMKECKITIPFFKKLESKLNKNEIALGLNDKLLLLEYTLQVVVMSAAAITLPLCGLSLFTNCSWSTTLENFNEKKLQIGALSIFTITGAICFLIKWIKNNKATRGSSNLLAGLNGIHIASSMYENLLEMIAFRRCVQEKLIHIATYLNNMKSMVTKVKSNPVISSHMPSIKNFDSKLEALLKASTDVKHLLNLLETNTFKGDVSVFSYTGRIYAAFQLMHQLKNQFLDAMLAVGEIDADMSCARLYKEFERKQVKFCFPTYITNAKAPSIFVQDSWNPVINPDIVVANSLAIGNEYQTPQNVIISGPNAGGKSTITKSFVISIILAQSLGIAPAQQLTFTPFKKIITYLNITDDIAAGNSHFKAGVIRARDIINAVKSTKDNGFCLTVLDEVFNGTTFKEGQAAAYSLIKMLGQNPHNICITNTHFPIIPHLEKETGQFKNYKVRVFYDENNRMQRPFKLEPGISDQVVTFKLLQEEGFGDDFLATAQKVIDRGSE